MRDGESRQYIEPMNFGLHPSTLASWRDWGARLSWPGQCALCGDWGPHSVCAGCQRDWVPSCARCPRCALPRPGNQGGTHPAADCPDCEARSPEFDRAVAALHYAAPWSTLISRLKFQGRTELGPALGHLLADAVSQQWAARQLPWPDVVMPVPVSSQRLAERGFNQSWLIARACASRLALPCEHRALRRVQHTERLMNMSAEERALALNAAFAVPPEHTAHVFGRHVALVDDVLTTGATLDAASMALREAGAHTVSVWVVAKTGRSS
jgi:ComF family protein